MIGKQILNYEIKSLLGEGGMGNVYLAEHTQLKRQVAIKSLHSQLVQNQSLRDRFKNEASTMAHLQHPNIVALYDYVEEQDGLYLIMEYVDGIPLDDYIKNQSGPIPEEQTIKLFQGILEGFNYAHAQGIIHRDIKPSNIILTKKDHQAKILDFGIAKMLNESDRKLTKTGTQIGTIYYMSPEQVKGQPLDITSDIYSLGVTLFQMLTGHNPYSAMTTEFEIYNSIVGVSLPEASSIYPGVSKKMERIIAKATAKNPKDRYKTCQLFLDDLVSNKQENHIITPIPVVKPENPKISTPEKKSTLVNKKPEKKSKALAISLLLIVVIVGSFFLFQFLNKESEIDKKDSQEIADTKEQYLISPSLNLRSEHNQNSSVIAELTFGSKITLLEEEQYGPDSDNILWVKVNFNGQEGWIAKEIRTQRKIAPLEIKNDFENIFGDPYNVDSEFTRIQTWVFFKIVEYLKSESQLGNYKIYNSSKELRIEGYHSCAVLNPSGDNSKTFNYAVILTNTKGNENKIVFLNGTDFEGSVTSVIDIPSEIKYISNIPKDAYYTENGSLIQSEKIGALLVNEELSTVGYAIDDDNGSYRILSNQSLNLTDDEIDEIINSYCEAVLTQNEDQKLRLLAPYLRKYVSKTKITNNEAKILGNNYSEKVRILAMQPYSNTCIDKYDRNFIASFNLGIQALHKNKSGDKYQVGYVRVILTINTFGQIESYVEDHTIKDIYFTNENDYFENHDGQHFYDGIECY